MSQKNPSNLVCDNCNTQFSETDGVWNFLPEKLRKVDLLQPHPERLEGKEGQLVFFSQNTEDYDDRVANSPFWKAEDSLIWDKWYGNGNKLKNTWVLDIGAGTGRASEYLTRFADLVVVTDIAPGALQLAKRRLSRLGRNNFVLLACDAETIPFKKETFAFVSAYGVLHHVEIPSQAMSEISRVLKPGGKAFTSENHKSALRPIFDLLMKLSPAWTEHAGSNPLLDKNDIKNWIKDVPLNFLIDYRAIVPPQLCNLLGHGISKPLLRSTNALVNGIPLLHALAGLIAIEFTKEPAKPAI